MGSVALLVAAAAEGCSSSNNDSPSTDDGGSSEASAASKDGSTVKEAAPVEVGDADASTCAPADVSSFTPTWIKPSGFNQKLCTSDQAQQLADCVYTHPGYDQKTCDAFFKATANKACVDCAYTTTSGKTLGAIVSNGTSVQVNYAGCIALATNDTSAKGCGASVQAAQLCQDAACVDNCPVPQDDTGSAFAAFQACEDLAAKEGCKKYVDAAACADAATGDGGAAVVCVPDTQDFGVRAKAYVDLFCGGLPSDGGSDANVVSDGAINDAPSDG